MSVSEKFTDQPGIEPGTFRLLVRCSTNWAIESDGENIIWINVTLGPSYPFFKYRMDWLVGIINDVCYSIRHLMSGCDLKYTFPFSLCFNTKVNPHSNMMTHTLDVDECRVWFRIDLYV